LNIILGLSLQRDVINYTRYEYNAADMLSAPPLPSSHHRQPSHHYPQRHPWLKKSKTTTERRGRDCTGEKNICK